jgi:phosphate butyryltransferase
MMLNSIRDVMNALNGSNLKTMAVVMAADDVVLETVSIARERGLADAILIDSSEKIRRIAAEHNINIEGFEIIDIAEPGPAAAHAVRLVAGKKADILMKGHIETKDFMHAVVAKDSGLKIEGRIISSMLAVELKKQNKFVFITDIGFVPLPDLGTKKKIIENAVETLHMLGHENPKVAVICATETVNQKMPATLDAQALEQMNKTGEITGCTIAGPISLDLAVSPEAAKHKDYNHPVAGRADLLVMPSLEVGNVMSKTFDYYTDNATIAIVMGAASPIVFTSRATRQDLKLNAIAFAVLLSQRNK